MANSPTHKFGQIIGEALESKMHAEIMQATASHGVFLDTPGPRKARAGKKIRWQDNYGNSHDLDLVLEKDGSEEAIGRPIAFIECAWRRYTKHSKNKVQEIQGALLPIVEKHSLSAPFFGAILAGEFTKNSLDQLLSLGFRVLYFPYESIVQAFSDFGLSMHWEEHTANTEVEKMIRGWDNSIHQEQIMERIVDLNRGAVDQFLRELESAIERHVTSITVLPLYGVKETFILAQQAISFLKGLHGTKLQGELQKIEIIISFSNKDQISATFKKAIVAQNFLRDHSYSTPTT